MNPPPTSCKARVRCALGTMNSSRLLVETKAGEKFQWYSAELCTNGVNVSGHVVFWILSSIALV